MNLHQSSNAHTAQQNGTAERMNRTLIEKGKSLLFDADLPKTYWAEAINMALYLVIRTVSSSHGKVPGKLHLDKNFLLRKLIESL